MTNSIQWSALLRRCVILHCRMYGGIAARTYRLLVALVVLITSGLHAQPSNDASGRIFAGGGVAGEVGFSWGEVPVYGGSTECGMFTRGMRFGERGTAKLMLPHLFADGFGMDIDASFGLSQEYLTTQPLDPQRVLDGESLELVDIDRELRLDARSMSIRLDIPFVWQTSSSLRFDFAPSIGLRFGAEYRATDRIAAPAWYTFTGGGTERDLAGWQAPQGSSFAIGAGIGVGWLQQIGEGLFLVPELRLRTEFLSSIQIYPWRSASLLFGLAILRDITPAPLVADIASPPEIPPVPPLLSASLRLWGISADGDHLPVATIHVNEVIERQHAPFVPMIFFTDGSDKIPSRYQQLNHSAALDFRTENLIALGPMEIHHRTLDILGSRLREDPSARISLIGSISSDEPEALARERAMRVREYLVETWGIQPTRISIETTGSPIARASETSADGRQENRRVVIASSNPDITAAVVTESLDRRFNPPGIAIRPSFQAEAGVRRWEIKIMQMGQVLGTFTSGTGSDTGGIPVIDWQIMNERIDTTLAPLTAELVVEDSAGGSVTANAEIPMKIERRVTTLDPHRRRDDERLVYLVTGFDYNSATPASAARDLLRVVASQVDSSSSITITGYTDRIGGKEYNATLSRERAEGVATMLRGFLDERGIGDAATFHIQAGGVDHERFSNDLPEGRVLSRSVSIKVEHH